MTVGINCFKVCLKIKALPHTSAFSYLLAQTAGAGSVFWFRKLLPSSRSMKTHFFRRGWARRCWLEVSSALPGSPESAHHNLWLLWFFFSHGAPGPSLWGFCTLGSYYEIHDSFPPRISPALTPAPTMIHHYAGDVICAPPPHFLVVVCIRDHLFGTFPTATHDLQHIQPVLTMDLRKDGAVTTGRPSKGGSGLVWRNTGLSLTLSCSALAVPSWDSLEMGIITRLILRFAQSRLAEDDLELPLLIILLLPPAQRQVPPHPVHAFLGTEPRAPCNCSKSSTTWATQMGTGII